jgi:hypothetical protein
LLGTAYEGRANAGGIDLLVRWVPQEGLRLSLPWKVLEAAPTRRVFVGDRMITLATSLTAAEGRLLARFEAEKREGLTQAEAPADAACMLLLERGKDFRSVLVLPTEGRFSFPADTWQEGALLLRKADASGTMFEAMIRLGKPKEGEGFTLGKCLPLTYVVQAERKGQEVKFLYACRDAAGRDTMPCRDGDPAPLPLLEILGPDGNILATHQYEAG